MRVCPAGQIQFCPAGQVRYMLLYPPGQPFFPAAPILFGILECFSLYKNVKTVMSYTNCCYDTDL